MADTIITTLRILGTRAYINGARASARAIRDVGKAGDETSAGMQLFKGSMASVAGGLGILTQAAKSAGFVLGATAIYGAKLGLEFDASIERSQVGMETLLGSAKEAKKTVEAVKAFALKAPMLSVAAAVQSSQQLIGAGLSAKKAVPTMTAFSDTLSAMGRRPEDLQRMTYAFQQMFSKGKVTAEELRGQLGEIFPASKLMARGMGISMAELASRMKEGSVTGTKPIFLLLQEMEKEFGGATKRSAETFSGQLNNMKENARAILGDVFKPLFDTLKNDVFPWVNKIGVEIGKWAKGGGPQRLIDAAKTGFRGPTRSSVRRVREGGGAMRTETVTKKVKRRGGIEGIVQTAGELAGKVIPEIVKVAGQLWDALKPAEPFLNNVLIPFVEGFAVGLYKGLIGLIPLIKGFATFLGWIGDKAKPIRPIIQGIGFVIGYVFGPGKLGVFRLFGKVLGIVARGFGKIYGWLIRVSPAVNRVVFWFLSLPGRVGQALGGLVGKVGGAMRKVGSALLSPFRSFGKKIAGFISASVGAVVSAIANFGKQIATALWNALPAWMRKLLTVGARGFADALKSLGGQAKPGTRGPGGTVQDQRRVRRPAGRNPYAVPRRAVGGPISGLAMVGERGPELANFGGGGFVWPTPKAASIPEINIKHTSRLVWKGREVALAVAEDTSDKKARR